MTIEDKSKIFGIHSVTPYKLSDGLPYSAEPFKVLGAFNASMSQEAIDLNGGSSFDAFDTELGLRTFEGTMTLRQVPNALIEILTGLAPTENAAENSGSVTTLKNVKGTSAQEGTTGIASVGLKSGDTVNVPFASYTVVVVSATTVDVYVTSDVDFKQGTNKTFQAGTHKVNASPLTIVASTPTEIPDFGIELTGGSGTIGMTIGDTAVFESRPANNSSRIVNIGNPCYIPPKIGLMAYGQRKTDGVMHKINIYKALAFGLPMTLTEKAYYEGEITFKAQRGINIFNGNEGVYEIESVFSQNLTS